MAIVLIFCIALLSAPLAATTVQRFQPDRPERQCRTNRRRDL